jgi:hypothetical protein
MASKVAFTSSVGRAHYPWLNKPDTAFGNEPKYKTGLILEEKDPLLAQLKEVAAEEFGPRAAAKAHMPFKTDEETGETVLTVKSKYAPNFFDSTGQNLVGKQVPPLRSGSELRVGGFIAPYSVNGKNGISLQLTRVQVVNPVSGDGSADGFDAVEGGFVGEELTQEAFDEQEAVVSEEATADRF